MILDILITLISLGLFLWLVIIEPVLKRLKAMRPPPPPQPRFIPIEPDFLCELEKRCGDDAGEDDGENAVRTGTNVGQYGVIRGGSRDTEYENQRYQKVRNFVQRGYSANQIVSLLGGSRARVLELVRRARKEFGL